MLTINTDALRRAMEFCFISGTVKAKCALKDPDIWARAASDLNAVFSSKVGTIDVTGGRTNGVYIPITVLGEQAKLHITLLSKRIHLGIHRPQIRRGKSQDALLEMPVALCSDDGKILATKNLSYDNVGRDYFIYEGFDVPDGKYKLVFNPTN